MRFVFIVYEAKGKPRTGSQHMRGYAIVDALKRQGVETHVVTHEDLRNAPIDKHSICIIVKAITPDIVSHAKKRNATVVYDMIDNWNWKVLNMPQTVKGMPLSFGFDVVIANNKAHAAHISKYYNGRITIIPHLHTNIHRKRKSIDVINTIGYIGLDKQFALTKEMTQYCNNNKLQWYQANGGDYQTVEQETLKLDVGLIYATNAMQSEGLNYEYVMKFKPATKLINYFSYGIPALFNPTIAFIEAIESDPKLKYLIVNTPIDIYNKINELRENNTLYKDLSNRCFSLSEIYHLDNAKRFYSQLV
jgi:hypothetical protein